jgi:hypothetical protein
VRLLRPFPTFGVHSVCGSIQFGPPDFNPVGLSVETGERLYRTLLCKPRVKAFFENPDYLCADQLASSGFACMGYDLRLQVVCGLFIAVLSPPFLARRKPFSRSN